jgi:hypothetical protein
MMAKQFVFYKTYYIRNVLDVEENFLYIFIFMGIMAELKEIEIERETFAEPVIIANKAIFMFKSYYI